MRPILGTAPTGGLRRWYAALAGIALWMLHITALAALAAPSCRHPAAEWAMHAITVVTALGTALAMWWSLLMARQAGPVGESVPSAAGRERFLALFGLATGAISLLLILWEGSYVLFIDPCRSIL